MEHQKGFTLVEIMVVIGIMALIATLGLFISMDFFRGRSAHSEQDTIVSILQNARSQSLNNIDQVRHGVHFVLGKYVIFECNNNPPTPTPQCTDYSKADTSKDLTINSGYNVTITPAPPFDIIFNQLDGNCITSNCSTPPPTITINDGIKNYNIIVNSEGQIDWK